MRRRGWIVTGVVCALAATARAQEEPAPRARELAGHVFTTSRLVRDPFTPTAFTSLAAYAYGKATAPDFNPLGLLPGTREYDLGGFAQLFELSVRVMEWLSLRVGSSATVFSGTSASAALVAGSSAQAVASAGLTAAHTFGDRVRAGVVFDFGWQPSYDLLVASSALRAIQQRTFSDEDVLRRTNTLTFNLGASAAWAISRFAGLQGVVRWVHPRREVNGDIRNFEALLAGAVVDIDLREVSPLRIALVGSYRIQKPFETGEAIDQEGGGGLYYTGRSELVLGADFTWRSARLRSGLDISTPLLTATVRYDWQ
jgi:hypothetical protein